MEKGFFAKRSEVTVLSETSSAEASAADAPLPGPKMIHLPEAQQLRNSGVALFIDSRHEFDYKLGHIAGAINIPLKDFDARVGELGGYPKDKPIVVYCDGAECNSSIEFAAKLFGSGFSNVRIFFGGWREWTAGNLPTEQEAQ